MKSLHSEKDAEDDVEIFIQNTKRKKEGKPQSHRSNLPLVHKVLIVGPSRAGKTSFCMTFKNKHFNPESVPRIFDNHEVEMKRKDGTVHKLLIFDTDYDMGYRYKNDPKFAKYVPETSLVVLCFNLGESFTIGDVRSIFTDGKEKGVLRRTRGLRFVPIILVGMMSDVRNREKPIGRGPQTWSSSFTLSVSRDEGLKLAEEVGAIAYLECSAKLGKGLKDVYVKCCDVLELQRELRLEKKNKAGGGSIGGGMLSKLKVKDEKSRMRSKLRKLHAAELAKEKGEVSKIQKLKRTANEYESNYDQVMQFCGELYEEHFAKLPNDVIRMILAEFVLIDFTKLFEFDPEIAEFRQYCVKLNKNNNKRNSSSTSKKYNYIREQFYGYFKYEGRSRTRNVFQVFFSFRTDFENRAIPKTMWEGIDCILPRKMLYYEKSRSLYRFCSVYYRASSSRSVDDNDTTLIRELRGVSKKEFLTLSKRCHGTLETLYFKHFDQVELRKTGHMQLLDEILKCQSLRKLFIGDLPTSRVLKDYYNRDLNLPNLVVLDLSTAVFCEKLSFAHFKQLEHLRLWFTQREKLHDNQLDNILKLKCLKRIVVRRLHLTVTQAAGFLNECMQLPKLKVFTFVKLFGVPFSFVQEQLDFENSNAELFTIRLEKTSGGYYSSGFDKTEMSPPNDFVSKLEDTSERKSFFFSSGSSQFKIRWDGSIRKIEMTMGVRNKLDL